MIVDTHADFIVAAYAITAFIVTMLIAWVALDYAAQRRMLGSLEDHGVKRRSQRPGGTP